MILYYIIIIFVIYRIGRMIKMLKKNAYLILFLIFLIIVLALLYVYNSKYVEKFSDNNYSIEYYYMPNCGHCKKFNSVWDELMKEVSGVSLKKYDITDSDIGSKRSEKFNINGAPTIIKVSKSDDKLIDEFNGNRTLEELKKFISK